MSVGGTKREIKCRVETRASDDDDDDDDVTKGFKRRVAFFRMK